MQHGGNWIEDNPQAMEQSGSSCRVRKCLAGYLGSEKKWDVVAFNAGIHDCLTGDQHAFEAIYTQIVASLAPGQVTIKAVYPNLPSTPN